MSDQLAMQDYVRRRLAGAEPAPAIAPDPAASYVLAQGARGSRVPSTTMMDSPQFLQEPAVGDETSAHPPSNKLLDLQNRHIQSGQILERLGTINEQMRGMPLSDPRYKDLAAQYDDTLRQIDALHEQYQATTGRWADREMERLDNRGVDATAIQDAIQHRQAQPRTPLSPPAPGGVPLNTPQVPVTRDLNY